MKIRVWLLAALLTGLAGCSHTQTRAQQGEDADREDADLKAVQTIGDVTDVGNVAPTQISGVGLVYGLMGTGGTAPSDDFRSMLIGQLQKQGVQNVNQCLANPDYAMVFVSARLPVGIRKGDKVECEVTLPPGSRATSLKGGILLDCPLKNFDSTKNIDKSAQSDTLLLGHILGHASGPLLVGFGEINEEVGLKRARIWDGATSELPVPFYLFLRKDQNFASVANAIAVRINAAFPDDSSAKFRSQEMNQLLVVDAITSRINQKNQAATYRGRGDTATAVNKEMVAIRMPFEYRLNPERYLTVVRNIPLREAPDAAPKYRKKLREMLLDPKETIRAAIRLEALGKDSIPILKEGLGHSNPLVRFAAAESLTYLGSTAGVEELGRLAQEHTLLRGPCITALASLDDSCSQARLAEMMTSSMPQVRYGAFRGLLSINESLAEIQGQRVAGSFWLHHVAPQSMMSLVHYASNRRAEIVVFGTSPTFKPPFTITAGSEFVITAAAGDDRCTVSRFVVKGGRDYKQCGLHLEEVMAAMVNLGGQYPEMVELLRQADLNKFLSCAVLTDQLPDFVPIRLLAACGANANQFKDEPEFQQALLAAQQDLGIVSHEPAKTSGSRP
jgi:hypothetical protein